MRSASSPVKLPLTRARRGLSRKQAGEAGKKSRGTLHPNWGEVNSAALPLTQSRIFSYWVQGSPLPKEA